MQATRLESKAEGGKDREEKDQIFDGKKLQKMHRSSRKSKNTRKEVRRHVAKVLNQFLKRIYKIGFTLDEVNQYI